MTIDPQNVSLGWTPVTKRTVGRKRVAKKGQVHHKYIPSVSFQVDEEVVPPSPGLTKMCSPKKKRVIRGKKSHEGSTKNRKITDARDKTELEDIFINVKKKMKIPNTKPKQYVRRVPNEEFFGLLDEVLGSYQVSEVADLVRQSRRKELARKR